MSHARSSGGRDPIASPDLPSIAQSLRETGIDEAMKPIRTALSGTQTSDASLWLSTRLSAAMEAYAARVSALAEQQPADESLEEAAR